MGQVKPDGTMPNIVLAIGFNECPHLPHHAACKIQSTFAEQQGFSQFARLTVDQDTLESGQDAGDILIIKQEPSAGSECLVSTLQHPQIGRIVAVAETGAPVERRVARLIRLEDKGIALVKNRVESLPFGRDLGLFNVGPALINADEMAATAGQRQGEAANAAALVEDNRARGKLQMPSQKGNGRFKFRLILADQQEIGDNGIIQGLPPVLRSRVVHNWQVPLRG